MTDNPYRPPASDVTPQGGGDSALLDPPRRNGIGAGWRWIVEGFRYFGRAPLIWIIITVIFFAIMLILSMIPLVSLVANLLSPIFMGGLMLGCRALDNGQPLKVGHLFEGFQRNTGSLAAVGGLYLLGSLLILAVGGLIAMLTGGGDMFAFMQAGQQGAIPDEATASMMATGVLLAALVVLALYVPLMMALWFAPALVVFHDLGAVAAMKASLTGCWRNVLPFLLYGLVGLVLIVVGLIPLGLGLLVVMPALIASVYVSYKDIFLGKDAPPADTTGLAA